MSKIAIMTDSNSGITRQEAKERGIHLVPMPFTIDEVNYLEGVNLSQEQFFEFLENKAVVQTSQPAPADVIDLYKRLLETHDEVIYIPMSSGLSGSCQTAHMLASDEPFEGRVFVVDNQRISVTQRQSVLDALDLAERGMSAAQIRDILLKDKFNCSIYIMMDTLYYLKRGGRITPAAAAIGTILKIKPVLQIQGEKLDAYAKARTREQGKKIMIEALKKDIETRFGGLDAGANERVRLHLAYTKELEAEMQLGDEMMEAFPGFDRPEIYPLSLSIACHTGPGALGVGVSQKLRV